MTIHANYTGFSIDVNRPELYFLAKIVIATIKTTKKIWHIIINRVPRIYSVGLRIPENGFVYQRANVKISPKKLDMVFN